MLIRYWFRFASIPGMRLPIGVAQGCGVSAFNYEDALSLLKVKVFDGNDLPPTEEVIENIDVSTLDNKQIIPNIGNVRMRGIWFPLGYE